MNKIQFQLFILYIYVNFITNITDCENTRYFIPIQSLPHPISVVTSLPFTRIFIILLFFSIDNQIVGFLS